MHSRKPQRRTLHGLLSASLTALLLLSGCASLPQPQPVPDPALYALDIPEPSPALPLTNESMAGWVLDLKHALALSNADRAALREWALTIQKGNLP